MPLFFWYDLFLKAWAEILKNFFVVFLGELKTPKWHFEINWHLVGRPSRVTNYYYHFAGPLCVSNWFCRRGAIRYIILANPSWHCFSQGQRQGTMKKSPMIMVSLILIYVLFFVGGTFWCTLLPSYHSIDLNHTMRRNLPKTLYLLIFNIFSLNFSLEFFIMIFFVTNQLNISKFLPFQMRKTLISY